MDVFFNSIHTLEISEDLRILQCMTTAWLVFIRQTHPGQEHPPASYNYFAPADALVGVS